MWKFVCSRFYRWSKIVVWVIALVRIGLSQTLTGAIITLALALGYSIIPPLIGRVCGAKDMYSYNHPSRSKIEEYKKTSPAMQDLSTLLQDVSNINKLNSGSGIQFSHLNININSKLYTLSLRLYLMPNEVRTDFIPKLKKELEAWYHCTGKKNPEKIQEELISGLYHDKNGFIAKNALFREVLEDNSLEQFEHDSSGWSVRLKNVGNIGASPRDIIAITECAESNGFRVSNNNGNINIYF